MTAADKILIAGIRDAQIALNAIQEFNARWRQLADACHAGQIDVATAHGQQIVALVETAVDLYLTSHKRIQQFDRIAQEISDGKS